MQTRLLVVGQRYRLLELLGSGAMGKVWLARDEQLNRDVAVKEVLIPSDLDDADRATLRARVLREARTAARLDDATVVRVYDVVDDGVRPVPTQTKVLHLPARRPGRPHGLHRARL